MENIISGFSIRSNLYDSKGTLCLMEYVNDEWSEITHKENIENLSWIDARSVIFATKDEVLQLRLIGYNHMVFAALKYPTENAIALHKLLWEI